MQSEMMEVPHSELKGAGTIRRELPPVKTLGDGERRESCRADFSKPIAKV